MATLIRTWLDFALQQMAAEAYLNQFLSGPRSLVEVLTNGNNNEDVIPVDQFTGKTRFVDLTGVQNANQITGSAQAFVARYAIIDHHANDATGFSATLLFDTQTNSYTLSMRSSEYTADGNGGDRSRDIFGADMEIKNDGFAFAQLLSMKRYFEDLQQGKTSDGTIDPTLATFFGNAQNQFTVTGYSLSGHLATVFTELYADRVAQAYTFNGAGRGEFRGVSLATEAHEADRMRAMLSDLDARLRATDPLGALFASGSALNIYGDERYLVALDAVKALYPTKGTQEIALSLPGVLGGINREDGAFGKIQQLFGHAVTGQDVEVVANSGIHAKARQLLIEGQPLIEDVNIQDPLESQFGNSHSLTLLVDSLALQDLFQKIDPTLTQAQMETIFKASSDAKAELFGQTHVAEGDTLELALDVLRKVFLGSQVAPTDFNDNAGGFGDLELRNQFYTHIQDVRTAVGSQSYQIVGLADKSSSEVFAASRQADATGLAYRFALQELSPLAVVGAAYTQHNAGGALDLYHAQTGQGTWTALALSDRADLLAERLKFTLADGTPSNASATLYEDKTAFFNNGRNATATEVVIFGGSENDPLDGRLGNDHLYGGAGDDVISGFDGQDYLEGGAGNDTLDGGSENDILLGQQGVDTLTGGSGNDRLNGGFGDDRLDGGTGSDQYTYFTSQGHDTINDSDKLGNIVFDRQVVGGGLHRHGAPDNTWGSLDGRFTFAKQGTDLVINNTVTIENFDFATGALGIHPAEAPDTSTPAVPTIEFGNNGFPTEDVTPPGEFDAWFAERFGAVNYIVRGRQGSYVVYTDVGDDQLVGGPNQDQLIAGLGNDQLFGANGDDLLIAGEGDDELNGGIGNDLDALFDQERSNVLDGEQCVVKFTLTQ